MSDETLRKLAKEPLKQVYDTVVPFTSHEQRKLEAILVAFARAVCWLCHGAGWIHWDSSRVRYPCPVCVLARQQEQG